MTSAGPGRQVQVGVQGEPAAHQRLLTANREPQHVLDPPVFDLHVHLDRPALHSLGADDCAASR